jgi:hypothetical protein
MREHLPDVRAATGELARNGDDEAASFPHVSIVSCKSDATSALPLIRCLTRQTKTAIPPASFRN